MITNTFDENIWDMQDFNSMDRIPKFQNSMSLN